MCVKENKIIPISIPVKPIILNSDRVLGSGSVSVCPRVHCPCMCDTDTYICEFFTQSLSYLRGV